MSAPEVGGPQAQEAPARPLHLRLAEHGKVLALAGDHGEALRHYREAMRLAQGEDAPAVFVRHYAWCALESLERAGFLPEVVALCEQVEAVYTARPPATHAGLTDLAAHRERKGVALFKQGDVAGARAALAAAVALGPSRVPVAAQLARWLAAGLTVTLDRLAAEQDRHRYWSVRPDTVTPGLAVALR